MGQSPSAHRREEAATIQPTVHEEHSRSAQPTYDDTGGCTWEDILVDESHHIDEVELASRSAAGRHPALWCALAALLANNEIVTSLLQGDYSQHSAITPVYPDELLP
eukprot:4353560-Amphidinium_carterae.1